MAAPASAKTGTGQGAATKDERRAAAANATTLDRLPAGVAARVLKVEGAGAVARRLMEMGIVPGAPVRVVKAAPLGDPIEVRVRTYHLALRRAEANTIQVVTGDR